MSGTPDQAQQNTPEPPPAGDETATLLGFLERQRATFAWKTGDLDSAGLRARLAPSAMTLGGLLNHLARFEDDMSTEWLHGRPQLPPWNRVDWDTDPDWDWISADEETPEALYGDGARQWPGPGSWSPRHWRTAAQAGREALPPIRTSSCPACDTSC